MRILKTLTSCVAAIATVSVSSASTVDDSPSIVDHLNSKDNCEVVNPHALNQRLKKQHVETSDTTKHSESEVRIVSGYRIQVFSDNNSRTAKAEARTMASNISERFPQYRTYVIYNSPFWRLRVGDFATADEAADAATEIKTAFPAYRKEVRVVRDRINLNHHLEP